MICVVCQLPDRVPERGQVCEPDRRAIAHDLAAIGKLYPRIDLAPSSTNSGSLASGKPDSRLPLAVDSLDLTMPARVAAVVDTHGDQTGHVSVASVLDSWVRDWRDVRAMREHLPDPTVPALLGWLADRLDWACDHHPAVDEFAAEISQLRATLRAVCGDVKPAPQRLWAPCPRCDQLTLRRVLGDAYPVRCADPDCAYAGTDDEYERYVGLYAAAVQDGRMSA